MYGICSVRAQEIVSHIKLYGKYVFMGSSWLLYVCFYACTFGCIWDLMLTSLISLRWTFCWAFCWAFADNVTQTTNNRKQETWQFEWFNESMTILYQMKVYSCAKQALDIEMWFGTKKKETRNNSYDLISSDGCNNVNFQSKLQNEKWKQRQMMIVRSQCSWYSISLG